METRSLMAAAKGAYGLISVTNLETNETVEYASSHLAAAALNVGPNTILRYIKSQKVFKKIYKLTR